MNDTKYISKYKGVHRYTSTYYLKDGTKKDCQGWKAQVVNPNTGKRESACFPPTFKGELDAAKWREEKLLSYKSSCSIKIVDSNDIEITQYAISNDKDVMQIKIYGSFVYGREFQK